MATIQIRDIPDDVHEELQRQARAAGQSLQAFMRQWVVQEIAEPHPPRCSPRRVEEVMLAARGHRSDHASRSSNDLDDDRR